MASITFEQAVAALRNQDVLLYPTETFYAVGCSALSARAVAAVYSAKERNKALPLPVIIGRPEQLALVAARVLPDAETLMRSFWPGPLTLLLPARSDLPPPLTAGTGRVAVRLSSHPAAARLAAEAGFPIVSSSANISGRPPVTRPEDLDPALLRAVRGALYTGGEAPLGGAPSTIVELVNLNGQGRMLHILREGAVPAESFARLGFACYKG